MARFDEADEELLLILAEFAAIGIHNARGLDQLASRREELERAVAALWATPRSAARSTARWSSSDARAHGQARPARWSRPGHW